MKAVCCDFCLLSLQTIHIMTSVDVNKTKRPDMPKITIDCDKKKSRISFSEADDSNVNTDVLNTMATFEENCNG